MANKLIDATLCFLIKKHAGKTTHVCLAMKKRGFGKDRWNGVGGKVEPQESIEDAAKREAFEEIGVILDKIEKVATLTFLFPNKPEWNLLVRVFIADTWEGEPIESEEMAPAWFAPKDIPYDNMWPDDIIWLPQVLDGSKVLGTFTFGDGDVILSQELSLVESKDLLE